MIEAGDEPIVYPETECPLQGLAGALDGSYDGEAEVIDVADLNVDPDEPTGVDQFSSLGKAKLTAQRPTPTPRPLIG
jgi:hypothetical protein